MIRKLLSASVLALAMGLPTLHAEDKPSISEASLATLQATVAAVNQETREVTLQGADGNKVTVTAGDHVKNLPQVEVGDQVTVEYYEAIDVKVFGPEGLETGAGAVAAVGRAEPGQKPGGLAVTEVTLVAEIEAIDKTNESVTLKGPEGNSKTVKVRDPANLDKVAVGDKVMITHTEAMAINVTETASE